jgi:hypothetical protein
MKKLFIIEKKKRNKIQKIFELSKNIRTIISPSCDVIHKEVSEWSNRDKEKFVEAIIEYGEDYIQITNYLGNKTIDEVKSYTEMFNGRLVNNCQNLKKESTKKKILGNKQKR